MKCLDNYSKDKSRVDGYHYYCKACNKAADSSRYEKNKHKRCKQSEAYYEANRTIIKEKQKDRYLRNTQYYKNWSQSNRDSTNKYIKSWTSSNRSKINEYTKNRRRNDPQYAMKESLRGRLRDILQLKKLNKEESTVCWLGCDLDFFKKWIASKFESWMTWDNRGKFNGKCDYGWDLDHIKPLSSAQSIEEVKKLSHYTNIQPLCSYVNRCIKRDSL